MRKTIEKAIGNIVAKGARAVAKNNANTMCPFVMHQPKLPDKVKKLRKF